MARRRYFIGFLNTDSPLLWTEVTSAYYHDTKRHWFHEAPGFEWQTFTDKSEQWYTGGGDAGCTTVDGNPPFDWPEGSVKPSIAIISERAGVQQ